MRWHGPAIREIRRARHLSVTALAVAVGVKQPHMTLIELGKRSPSDDLALHIAQVLGITDLRAIQVDPGTLAIDVPDPKRRIA
jgi:transcriptional regulator with XRE-family HTH domain